MSLVAAQYGSVSDIEIIWMLIAVTGFVLAIKNLRDAREDRRVLEAVGQKNGRAIIARAALWAESLRVVIQTIFITIGIAAMTIQDPPSTLDLPLNEVVVTAIVRWGIIIAAALVVAKSALARWTRYQIIRSYREERAQVDPQQLKT